MDCPIGLALSYFRIGFEWVCYTVLRCYLSALDAPNHIPGRGKSRTQMRLQSEGSWKNLEYQAPELLTRGCRAAADTLADAEDLVGYRKHAIAPVKWTAKLAWGRNLRTASSLLSSAFDQGFGRRLKWDCGGALDVEIRRHSNIAQR
jgi:hypothetical protein